VKGLTMPKDLKNVLDNIEKSQDKTARMEEKIEKLTQLANKQKKIISEQTLMLEKQKARLSKMVDIPDDIRELREIIGTQRGQLNEKDIEINETKGLLVQAQKELELTTSRMKPTQIKLDATLGTLGTLKQQIVQKNAEIVVKDETLRTFQNKIQELTSFKNQINELRIDHVEEKKVLNKKVSQLESQLLQQKLDFQEELGKADDVKEQYQNILPKIEDLNNKIKEANETIKNLEKQQEDLKNFKQENINKITYLDTLKPLMEEDPLFKGFFIIQQVGSITLEDLKGAIGAPIVLVKRGVQRLQDIGLVEMSDDGKISAKDFRDA